jgi:hypothetical protein
VADISRIVLQTTRSPASQLTPTIERQPSPQFAVSPTTASPRQNEPLDDPLPNVIALSPKKTLSDVSSQTSIDPLPFDSIRRDLEPKASICERIPFLQKLFLGGTGNRRFALPG